MELTERAGSSCSFLLARKAFSQAWLFLGLVLHFSFAVGLWLPLKSPLDLLYSLWHWEHSPFLSLRLYSQFPQNAIWNKSRFFCFGIVFSNLFLPFLQRLHSHRITPIMGFFSVAPWTLVAQSGSAILGQKFPLAAFLFRSSISPVSCKTPTVPLSAAFSMLFNFFSVSICFCDLF